LFNLHQVANLLGVRPAEVVEWARKGELPVRRTADGGVGIPEKGLVQFLQAKGIDLKALAGQADPRESDPQATPSEPPQPQLVSQASPPDSVDAGIYSPPRRRVPQDEPAEAVDLPADALQARAQAPAVVAGDELSAEGLLRQAVARRAGGILLESAGADVTLRLRVDGVLQSIGPREGGKLSPAVFDQLRTLAGIVEGAEALSSGRFSLRIDEAEYNFALVSCPTLAGQRLVVQISGAAAAELGLADLGLAHGDLLALQRILAAGRGLVLVAGLPRMGKATTVACMARSVMDLRRDVVAVLSADQKAPPGLPAVRADEAGGMSPAEIVRSLVSQDADAIVLPEIRDAATCRAAVDAAADTMVIASIAARDTHEALILLLETGIDRWSLASSLQAVVTQVLARRLCPACRQPAEIDDELRWRLGLEEADRAAKAFGPGGCDDCGQGGYAGRIGIFSTLLNDRLLAAVIRKGAAADAIVQSAALRGRPSLRAAMLEQLQAGTLSPEEADRLGMPGE
jgi:type II secretory ATPase GspE/PulE/Tfp pilus assembly ATPase PilB-like protein